MAAGTLRLQERNRVETCIRGESLRLSRYFPTGYNPAVYASVILSDEPSGNSVSVVNSQANTTLLSSKVTGMTFSTKLRSSGGIKKLNI